MRRPDIRHLLLGALALVTVGVLSGCTGAPPTAPRTTAATSATASASPTPEGPVLVPDGTAEDNLPLFTKIMDRVWASDSRVKGRAYIDALVRAGFDRDAMEVTPDKTSVGLDADSIQFSVLWDDECLVGQVGPSTKQPTAVVVPELPSGGCLIGQTRPIDW